MSDRPSTEIQPALTAEEWRTGIFASLGDKETLFRRWVEEGDTVEEFRHMFGEDPPDDYQLSPYPVLDIDKDAIYRREDCHALAAACLHGQPFGFTHEDVATLRDTLALIGGWMPGPEPSRAEQVLASLKARISALLPPTP